MTHARTQDQMPLETELKYLISPMMYLALHQTGPHLPDPWVLWHKETYHGTDVFMDTPDRIVHAAGFFLRKRGNIADLKEIGNRANQIFDHPHPAMFVRQEIEAQPFNDLCTKTLALDPRDMEEVLRFSQTRDHFDLYNEGQLVGTLSLDKVDTGGCNWREMEIEFLPIETVGDALAIDALSYQLTLLLDRIKGFNPCPASKYETALLHHTKARTARG